MKPILIHIPHSSLFIPEEYKKTALISQNELDEENLFMCDTGILSLVPEALQSHVVTFPYSRLYCEVSQHSYLKKECQDSITVITTTNLVYAHRQQLN